MAADDNRPVSIEIGPHQGNAREYVTAVYRAFGDQVRDEDVAAYAPLLELDRALTARDGERLVGTAAIVSFDLSVPGGSLPSAGVSMVGVQPTHRRRGILRGLMRRQLDDVHERGEALACLWASEASIYQRFGYGLAALRGHFSVARDRTAFRTAHVPVGSMRLVELDEARVLVPPIFEALRPTIPGAFTRSPAFWESEIFFDPEHRRHGAGAAFHAVHETDGAVDGYARYRIKHEWDDRGAKSELMVSEALGLTPGVQLDVWRYLFDIDLIGIISAWNVPADDPLLLAVAEPRRLAFGLGDALWLRVVDVAAALAGRRYAADGAVVIELTDEFCPWNAGRWSLESRDGTGHADRTEVLPDLELDTTDLAAVYLGGFGVGQLLRAGRGQELRSGAAARADGLLRGDRAPWCSSVF